MDPDLVSLLAVADQLLGSLSTSVVLAAAGLLLHLAPAGSERGRHATYTLVQLLNRDYFTSYVVLNVIDELSALDATTFARYVGDFLPRISEPVYIVQSKTRILCRLIAEETVEDVLAALQPFTVHPSADVVVMLVKTLLVVSQKNPASSRLCLRVFTQLLDLRREDVAIARACLMGADRLLHVLDDAAKREALVWMMKLVLEGARTPLYDGLLRLLLHHCATVLPQAEEACRQVLKQYAETAKSTRLALLLLLVKLHDMDPANATVAKMAQYVQELNSRDIDVDVRVQERNVRVVGVEGLSDA